ncbi:MULTISPECIES: DUF3489 domain-containing protein [Mesorhizobium]|uniref:DUF3489 domain-containing protein n=1 Tax=Mesorhizobium japonicum R7A TaxID=935547 RepID=A0ABX6MN28_9HYPH|nr:MULTISPECIES: DUF3489 domain-containing protein [Mesorhizobium]MBE1707073.1 DUF3489 domain-containing protein [Mesorhizobium japonicum]MBE1716028.1 DUF3489 domain-containing protein [Mesorhizobium japonicum]MUT20706.1 DUF3489 domain-containing protein [Mesorhizobium japonicum]MUT28162.1 DUF3489 domain-containing protein [Mesorhizobium japonicum]PBB11267.1 DUF3489 domain-containing protein [Mesorhizobium loti]
MGITETGQTESTGAGEPQNTSLQAVATPPRRPRKQAAAHADVPNKSKNPKPAETKTEIVLKKLRLAKGVTLEALVEATGWQPHSVRGFLSGTVKKKLGQPLVSEVGKDGVRRYRLDNKAKAV